jgi:hypothetical protein
VDITPQLKTLLTIIHWRIKMSVCPPLVRFFSPKRSDLSKHSLRKSVELCGFTVNMDVFLERQWQ